MSNLLDDLNKKQKLAAQTLKGAVLVLAGAGSGKTRTLTYRTANLIAEGVDPKNILTVTFTNRAADDMKAKISKLIGTDIINKMNLGTFHSICLKILRDNLKKVDRSEGCLIYDTTDSIAIVEDIIFDFDLEETKYDPKTVYNIISKAKMELVNPNYLTEKYAQEDNQWSEHFYKIVSRVYNEYERVLTNNNCFDFNDLIKKTIELLEADTEILKKYQNQFKYIQVDEYQDVNHSQYHLISLLAKPQKNIFVVGDDWQGIYGFRGADISNILEFEYDYPEAEVIKLERNYRSSNNIISASNQLINNNIQNKKKEAWTAAADGAPIFIAGAESPLVEAKYVCRRINHLVDFYNYKLSDIAILCRSHFQSIQLQNQLPKFRIPHQLVGGVSFFDRQEIRYFVNYLKLLVNPNDRLALKRLFRIEVHGVGEILLSEINKYARKNQMEITDVFESPTVVKGIGNNKAANIIEFQRRVIDSIYDLREENLPMHQKAFELYQRVDFDKNVLAELDDPEGRKKYMNMFLDDMADFQKNNPGRGLYDYLLINKLISDKDITEDNQEKVKVMTAHSAKGLEFPVVFIIGVEEEVFPHLKSLEEKESGQNQYAVEEERRLFYVAMTRAEKLLFISFSKQKLSNKQEQYKQIIPSRFLYELPDQRLDFTSVESKKGGSGIQMRKNVEVI
ncbi:ATP-dependent helicase [Halanaerobium congolense]|uniref:ATP-dependent helicase n=1 Tax=Halanaerobium congolense TaxID=54121 RepID=UPI0008902B23|nr:UvrD-helicase domain-containing protein [Halanaerobium congolense]SDK88082.1 DNA helicase-2 / ATP-dependent DNA helicase PcrA [Halanaerobium congolense]SDM70111.1 DNA helicase-2 / ATP-dependent DNA helicase PcrA [Halanaerobium congolense]